MVKDSSDVMLRFVKKLIMTEKSKWIIDPNHSEVQFKVKHLMISNVSGTFNSFKGELETEKENFDDARIAFEIDTASIDTNQPERDTHLKSPLFLNVDKFPKINFEGALQKINNDYKLEGELSLYGTTKKVQLEVEYTGTGTGRFGDTRAGFEINGKINRKDFGLNFNLVTDTGSIVVGEDIKLHFDMQLIKQN